MNKAKIPEHIKTVVLDWDYETFSIPRDGSYVLYNESLTPEDQFVYLEGWPSPGQKLSRTLFQRIPETDCWEEVIDGK
jgi:hypothetical protein